MHGKQIVMDYDQSSPSFSQAQRSKKYLIAGAIAAFIIFIAAVFLWGLFAGEVVAKDTQLVIPQSISAEEANTKVEALVGSRARALSWVRALRGPSEIIAGGYIIPAETSVWKLAGILNAPPQMVWVTIPEGWRKEEIARILAEKLKWGSGEVDAFLAAAKSAGLPAEGVYFPDTYLIDRADTGEKAARRFLNHFNETFAPYQKEFAAQNIKWDTGLKMASLVQREAGGKADMPVIASVLWNRLQIGMKLDIDATVQYALGTSENWWPVVRSKDKEFQSPYNTYRVKGLPPAPIANPGLDAIEAVLHPANTKCLYYLHDTNRVIHCAATYEEHQENIIKYLR